MATKMSSGFHAAYSQALRLHETGAHAQALAVLAPVLPAQALPFEVRHLAAALYERLGRLDAALGLYETLASQETWNAGILNALGRVHALRRNAAQALDCFEQVLAREPQNAEALFYRGNALRMLYRREEAIEAYRAVLPLHPDFARLALLEMGRQQQALLDFDSARVSYLQHYIISGGSLESMVHRLSNEHHSWPVDHAQIAAMAGEAGRNYAARISTPALPPSLPRAPGQRLRIGLVSADLWSHPVGYFSESLLTATAARKADWFVYHNRTPQDDPVTQRLRAQVCVWRDVLDWTDERLARQIRGDGIDVLVDLSGYSAHHRLPAFAGRPAPLQLSWLGYHGTTGLPFIDAVIADPICVRPGEEHFFTEPLLRLPHTRFCYTPQPGAPALAPSPVKRHGVVTFGCFQHAVKVGPQVLEAWARIARALPEARWVLAQVSKDPGPSDRERLLRRFAAAGFTPAHLELRGLRPMPEYLAGYADVDLILDTFPFTGGTTTAEALWMGVPTLTLSLPGMISRQGEQIMKASGLPEWVSYSVDEYVNRAVELGRNALSAPWTALRPSLREHLRGTPFFDGERFGRDWMNAVTRLWAEKVGGTASTQTPSTAPRLVFYVPAFNEAFGGVKMIYEIVAALNRMGHEAYTYTPAGSNAGSFWSVEKHELREWTADARDIVIAPEIMDHEWLQSVKAKVRAVLLLVQNWMFGSRLLLADTTPQTLPLDGVLTVSDLTQATVQRCLPQLPNWRVPCAIAPAEQNNLPARAAIAYMPRKLRQLARTLRAQWPFVFPELADLEWLEIDGLPHAQALDRLRQARYFVSLQSQEGFGLPALEAMAQGCLVIGFTGIGGREYARPDNGFWLDEGDGPALLETLGRVIAQERADPGAFDAMRRAGQETAARYSPQARDRALAAAFSDITQRWQRAPSRTS